MKKYWPAAAVLVSLVAGTALANDETLSFAKATDGSILITLSGVIPYCDALMGGGFQGSPQFTINGNQIGITSTVLLGECPAPPPGFPPPAPTPYSLTISAGQLPNGTYTGCGTSSAHPLRRGRHGPAHVGSTAERIVTSQPRWYLPALHTHRGGAGCPLSAKS
jgi:hypothetical protein